MTQCLLGSWCTSEPNQWKPVKDGMLGVWLLGHRGSAQKFPTLRCSSQLRMNLV